MVHAIFFVKINNNSNLIFIFLELKEILIQLIKKFEILESQFLDFRFDPPLPNHFLSYLEQFYVCTCMKNLRSMDDW